MRDFEGSLLYLLKYLIGVFEIFSEGQTAKNYFVQKYAQGPHINRKRVSIAFYNLRGHVLRSANNGVGFKTIIFIQLLHCS